MKKTALEFLYEFRDPLGTRDESQVQVQWPVSPDAYELYEKLPSKNRVWRARVHFAEGQMEAAVRVITYDPSVADVQDIVKSVDMLRSIPHGSALRVLHWFVDEPTTTLWLVYEPTNWLSLYELLEGSEQGLDESLIAAVLKQVLPIVADVHKAGLAWYDIRPVHLLLSEDGSIRVLLHSLRSIVRLKTRDSLPFVAPEQLQPKTEVDRLYRLRFKGDIWALGVTAVSLLLAHSPYEQMTLAELTEHIQQFSPLDEIKSPITPEFNSFLDMCFGFNPEERPTADELMRHPFIASAPGREYIQTHLVLPTQASQAVALDESIAISPPTYHEQASSPATPTNVPTTMPGALNPSPTQNPNSSAAPSVTHLASAPGVTTAMHAAAANIMANQTPLIPRGNVDYTGSQPNSSALQQFSSTGPATASHMRSQSGPPATNAAPAPSAQTPAQRSTGLAAPVQVSTPPPQGVPTSNYSQGVSPQGVPTQNYAQGVTPGNGNGNSPQTLTSPPVQHVPLASATPQSVASTIQKPPASAFSSAPLPSHHNDGHDSHSSTPVFAAKEYPPAAQSSPTSLASSVAPSAFSAAPIPATLLTTNSSVASNPSTSSAQVPQPQNQPQGSQPQQHANPNPTPAPASTPIFTQTNIPMECYLAESKYEFIVFIRAIPNTQIKMMLESRTLHITGSLPALSIPQGEDLLLKETVQRNFEKTVTFPAAVNANSFSKSYNKTASTLTIRIRKFAPVDLGSETF